MFYFIKKFKKGHFFSFKRYKIYTSLFIVIALLLYVFCFQNKKSEVVVQNNPIPAIENNVKEPVVISGIIQSKQTCSKLISEFFKGDVVQDFLSVSNKVYPLKSIRSGQAYTIIYTEDEENKKQFKYFEYEIDQQKKLVVEKTETGLSAQVSPINYAYELTYIDGVINTSLFDAIACAGESPVLASYLVNIFGAEIDFIKDLRVGDSFGILVEKRFKEGVFKGYGRILAAKITNKGILYEGYRFPCDKGFEQYYTSKGESLKRMFLKAPLAFTRISSGFSLSRKHPVHADRRPHLGIDYAAPIGTPVKTVGDGTIKKIGWMGGYGNVIVVRHKNGFESMYGHLSKYASNIKVGKQVKQGQTIGFVGATGVATGPHLDFRIKQQGKFVNPVKMLNPRLGSIATARMDEYKHLVLELKAYMNGTQSCSNYKPEKFL